MNFIDGFICLPILAVVVVVIKKKFMSKKRKCGSCDSKKQCKNHQNG